jgi:hypothetical protein
MQLYPPLELTTDDPTSYEPLCNPDLPDVFGMTWRWPGPVGDPALFGAELPLTFEQVTQFYKP